MNRIIFTGGQVFDGTGAPPVPGDVVVRGDRVESVRPGGGTAAGPGDQVVGCAGATVMPGLIESHSHLTFPSATGHIDPSFNPPLDVSFFRPMPTPDEHLAIARRNAKILLDHGFTSSYSAGSLTPGLTEVRLRGEIATGATPGPRMRAASFERDNNPVQTGPDGPKPKKTGPDGVREFIAEQAAIGFDAVKLLMSNDDVFTEGGSMITQYSQEEAQAAGEQARASGVWLNCHAQSPSRSSWRSATGSGSGRSTTAPTPTPRRLTCWKSTRTRSSCPPPSASCGPTCTRAPSTASTPPWRRRWDR